jgi:hypothetical protein
MDNTRILKTGLRTSLLSAAIAMSLGAASVVTAQPAQAQQPQQIIQDWPDVSKQAAKTMMDKYGQPDESTESMLIWENNGPWRRTIVYKQEIDHDFPIPHKDVLEQFIPYDADPDKFDELANYDGSVIVERTKGEMSARCDKEAANFLALNLADKIVKGEMGVEEARQAYADAIKQIKQGNTPEIAQKFMFNVPREYAGEPGERIIMAEK